MKVALLGGTGDIGRGLAVRLAGSEHRVVVGSRDAERGREAAKEITETTGEDVDGGSNQEAAGTADAVVLCVPYRHAVSTIEEIAGELPDNSSVVTPVVPMERDGHFRYTPPEEGSAAKEIRGAVPDPNPVAGAFHNVSSARLNDLGDPLGMDILVFGEDEAKRDAVSLTEAVEGLRALDAGGLGVAPQVEAITPLLINLGMRNPLEHPGVRFV